VICKDFGRIKLFISHAPDGNMSFKHGQYIQTQANRDKFFQKIGVDNNLYEAGQSHGSKLKIIKNTKLKIFPQTDALLTDLRDAYLFLKVGDCLPLFFYEPSGVIALVHAGWRGLDQNIHGKAFKLLTEKFHLKKENIQLYVGPHIKKCCYVYGYFPFAKRKKWQAFLHQKRDKIYCDLTGFTVSTLEKAGLPAGNIEISDSCTAEDKNYFSHYLNRKKGLEDKLFALAAVIKKDKSVS